MNSNSIPIPISATPSQQSHDTGPLPCFECAYDLRGSETMQCPECGEYNDRSRLVCATMDRHYIIRQTVLLIMWPAAAGVLLSLLSFTTIALSFDETAQWLLIAALPWVALPAGLYCCLSGARTFVQWETIGSERPCAFKIQPIHARSRYLVHYLWIAALQCISVAVVATPSILFLYYLF